MSGLVFFWKATVCDSLKSLGSINAYSPRSILAGIYEFGVTHLESPKKQVSQ